MLGGNRWRLYVFIRPLSQKGGVNLSVPSALYKESWTWKSLEEAILRDPSIRSWVHFPEEITPIKAKYKFNDQIFGEKIFGTYVNVYENSWGIVVKANWNPIFKDAIAALAKELGGSYRPKYTS